METTVAATIAGHARSDAALFNDVFPHGELDGSDWDAAAFEHLPIGLRETEGAWDIYGSELRFALGRIRANRFSNTDVHGNELDDDGEPCAKACCNPGK